MTNYEVVVTKTHYNHVAGQRFPVIHLESSGIYGGKIATVKRKGGIEQKYWVEPDGTIRGCLNGIMEPEKYGVVAKLVEVHAGLTMRQLPETIRTVVASKMIGGAMAELVVMSRLLSGVIDYRIEFNGTVIGEATNLSSLLNIYNDMI